MTAHRGGTASRAGEPIDLLTMGETLICLTAPGPARLEHVRTLHKSIGGAESNTAVGLARLGRRVTWLSRVGADPFGEEIIRTLRGEGVDVRGVGRMTERSTGLMVKELRTPEDIRVHYFRHGSAASELDESDVTEGVVATARRVHLTGITMALGPGPRAACRRMLGLCKQLGVPVSFDPNLRLKLWDVREAVSHLTAALPYVDDLLANEQEALRITGAPTLDGAVDDLLARGPQSVVIKRGASGAVGVQAGTRVETPAVEVAHPVDAVGAGDAFNAGFLHGRLDGLDLAQCMALGAWTASYVVAHPGDYEGLPDRTDLATRFEAAPPVHR